MDVNLYTFRRRTCNNGYSAWLEQGITQQTHDVVMTSYGRRCDVIASHRRQYDVISSHVPAGKAFPLYKPGVILAKRQFFWCDHRRLKFGPEILLISE